MSKITEIDPAFSLFERASQILDEHGIESNCENEAQIQRDADFGAIALRQTIHGTDVILRDTIPCVVKYDINGVLISSEIEKGRWPKRLIRDASTGLIEMVSVALEDEVQIFEAADPDQDYSQFLTYEEEQNGRF